MWNNWSVETTKGVWKILSIISKILGGLPGENDIQVLRKRRYSEILDCGQCVLDDDVLWTSLPEIIKIKLSEWNLEELRSTLEALDNFVQNFDDPLIEVNVETEKLQRLAEIGYFEKERGEFRQLLQTFLDESK